MATGSKAIDRNLQVMDLFCGAGGLTKGFRDAGYAVSFALDSDLDSCETYSLNHRNTRVEHASIADLSPQTIRRRAGRVDVIVGGPSCQGFSTHGRQTRWVDPKDERNGLWSQMLSVVDCVKPKAFLMENVPGMVYWKKGTFGHNILSEFRKLGYSVDLKILLAADWGVPQRRRRLFIVGLLGENSFVFPEQTHMGGWRRDSLAKWEKERRRRRLLKHVPCWDAIGDLPALGSLDGTERVDYLVDPVSSIGQSLRNSAKRLRDHEAQPLQPEILELVRHVPAGGTWRDIPPYLLPDRYRGMRRTDSTNLLGRLDPRLPAYTITTQYNNVTGGCFIHPYEDRALTVREGARLQTFPDTYRFTGSLTSRCRQVGNAVPPALASVLAIAIADQIDAGRKVVRRRPKPLIRSTRLPGPPTTPNTRKRMQLQARSDTRAEILVQNELDELGLTYETDVHPIIGLKRKADIVFRSNNVAVFVDGCFWHGCPTHSRDTKSNTKWWKEKIDANKRRDIDTSRRLRVAGWRSIRIWEHESPNEAAYRIFEILDSVESGSVAQ